MLGTLGTGANYWILLPLVVVFVILFVGMVISSKKNHRDKN